MADLPIEPAPLDPLKEIKAKLTDAEKENFFKAFLADKPYIADEAIFNGKIPVKFKTLSVAENNKVMLQMQYDRDSGVAQQTDKYLIQVILYRIISSLISLNGEQLPDPTNIKATDKQTDLIERLQITDKWPTFKVSSLTDAFNRFEQKVRALTEESFKPNF